MQLSLCSSLCLLSVSPFPCAPLRRMWLCPLYILLLNRYRYYNDLPWFFSSYGKANPPLSSIIVFIILLSGMCMSLLSWGAQNSTQYAGCISAVWEERKQHLPWSSGYALGCCWPSLLQELLTHVQLSCLWGLPAPFLQIYFLASWTLTCLVAQGYSISAAGLLLAAVRCTLVTQVQNELQILFSLIEKAA